MKHPQFVVDDDGLLSESAALDQADWYVSKFPSGEPIDFVVHAMITRAYDALKTDAPFEHRGRLTKARYNVLRMLAAAEEHRMLMTDIVQSMNVSPTNITKLVDGLERDNYVRRAGNLNDKRKVWVELLPAGAEAVEEVLPEVVEHVSTLWQGLSFREKRVLVHLLSKLRLDILTQSAGEQLESVASPAVVRASA